MIKKILKTLSADFIYWSGINYLYLKSSAKRNLVLLRYHSVTDGRNADQLHAELYPKLYIASADFRKQLSWLKESGYSFLTFDRLSELAAAGKPLPPKPVIIYFDDGFKDNLLNARPILKEMNIPATLFLTTDFVDQKDIPWSFQIRYLAFKAKDQAIYFGGEKFDLADRRSRVEAAERIINKGKLRMDAATVKEETAKLENTAGISAYPAGIFLDWNDLGKMADVFTFGSHAVSHRKLVDLETESVTDELVRSKQMIEEKTGHKIIALSYPHGSYNAGVEKIAREAGYKLSVTTDDGINETINPMRLKSIKAETSGDFKLFKLKMGAYYPLLGLLKR